jgi:hypothetical protein
MKLPTFALSLLVLLGVAGCSKDDPVKPVHPGGGSDPSTQLTGSFLNSSEAGLLTVDIATRNLAPRLRSELPDTAVTATGVASLESGIAVILSGTYNPGSDSLKLSGQGYSFRGFHWSTAVPPHVEGSFDGPNGPGYFGCMPGTRNAVKVLCGHFQSGSTSTTGRWDAVLAGTTLLGFESPSGDSGVVGFSGTVTGTSIMRTLTFSTGGEFVFGGSGTWDTETDHAAGTWAADDDAGTWSADLCPLSRTDRTRSLSSA